MYLSILLWHKDRVKNPRGTGSFSRLQNRNADPTLMPFKFLFSAYRPEMWWYEVVETIRRLTLTGLLVLVPDPDVRLSVAIFLAFASFLLHTITQPFADPATNTLALVSHLLVFMVFFVGQQIAIGIVKTEDLAVGIALVFLLVVLPILIVYSVMTQAARDLAEELRRHEQEVQAEELFETLDQLKAKEDEFCARDLISRLPWVETGPPPNPPPSFLNFSKNDVKFESCSFPCYVMSLTDLLEQAELPSHEKASQAGLLQTLTPTSQASIRHHAINCTLQGLTHD